jgi:hypothetical protein
MKSFLLFIRVSTVFLAVVLLCGCSKKSGFRRFEPLIDYMQQQDQLTAPYLHGDAAQARKSLGKLMQYYQDPNTKLMTDTARAQMVYQTYCRLFMLETRTGHEAEAQAALAKAREWQLQFYKLANAPNRVPDLTLENIQALVDEIDKRENGGQLPQYVQTIPK